MKFVFLLCESRSEEAERAAVRAGGSPEALAEYYRTRMAWFQQNGAKLRGGQELKPTQTATTVRRGVVSDGPFIEGNEVIGGYVEVEVEDLDEALALARDWPGGSVEVRPVFER